MSSGGAVVDVLVPVYNAPDLTKRCLISLAAHLPATVRRIHVHDNHSGEDTRAMLAALDPDRLVGLLAPDFLGFGQGVNHAAAGLTAPYLLVVNSDTMASDDFLSPMLAALQADASLAAVIPFGNTFSAMNPASYAAPGGLLSTHHLHGYAFLIRRESFQTAGGFDPCYGLGYFEDSDLGLRLIAQSHRLALHLGVRLHHEIAGSFGKNPTSRKLFKDNEVRFHSRFPHARERVLLLLQDPDLAAAPPDLCKAMAGVFEQGGFVCCLTPGAPRNLPAYEALPSGPPTPANLLRQLQRGGANPYKRPTRLWLGPGVSLPPGLAPLARLKGLSISFF